MLCSLHMKLLTWQNMLSLRSTVIVLLGRDFAISYVSLSLFLLSVFYDLHIRSGFDFIFSAVSLSLLLLFAFHSHSLSFSSSSLQHSHILLLFPILHLIKAFFLPDAPSTLFAKDN